MSIDLPSASSYGHVHASCEGSRRLVAVRSGELDSLGRQSMCPAAWAALKRVFWTMPVVDRGGSTALAQVIRSRARLMKVARLRRPNRRSMWRAGRSVAVELVALEALRQVGLDEQLRTLGFNQRQLPAAIGTVVARMAIPGSERATHQRCTSGWGNDRRIWRWRCTASRIAQAQGGTIFVSSNLDEVITLYREAPMPA